MRASTFHSPMWRNRGLLLAYLAAVATNQAGLWRSSDQVASAGQLALAPIALLSTAAGRSRPLGMAALIACFLADLIPKFLTGDDYLYAYVGVFTIAQILFLLTFWKARWERGSFIARLALFGTLALLFFLLVQNTDASPVVQGVVALYAFIQVLMASSSAGAGLMGAVGGVAMIICDGLVGAQGLGMLPLSIPLGSLVMASYSVGLWCLASAFSRLNGGPDVPRTRRRSV